MRKVFLSGVSFCLALTALTTLNSAAAQIDLGGRTMTVLFLDADGDGHGDRTKYIQSAQRVPGYVENATDCDDTNAAVYFGAKEIQDGIDNNCDGRIDEKMPFHDLEEVREVVAPSNSSRVTNGSGSNFSKHQMSASFDVWPNPAESVINIDVHNLDAEMAELRLIDMSGRVIIKKVIVRGQSLIDLSDLTPGIYSLIVAGANSMTSKKIIVK